MGVACADNADRPSVCSLSIGDFVMFAGDASDRAARYLVQTSATPCYVLPSSREWLELVRRIREHATPERYDLSSSDLSRARLERLADSLAPPFRIERFSRRLVDRAAEQEWSLDLVGNFESPEDFLRNGIGFGVVEVPPSGGRLVAGASSFAVLNRTVEFQVDTHPEYRRRGLATAVAATLAIACIDRNLVPHWDAASKASLTLAEKLGFRLTRRYEVAHLL
jgi:GNAT superfamily N-acetyltransferase